MREGEEIRQQLSMVTMYGHEDGDTAYGGWRMEDGEWEICDWHASRRGVRCSKNDSKTPLLTYRKRDLSLASTRGSGGSSLLFLVSQVCSRVAYKYAFFSSRVSCLLQHSLVSISITSFRERTPTKPANVPRAWT